jgi:hypothetical protein
MKDEAAFTLAASVCFPNKGNEAGAESKGVDEKRSLEHSEMKPQMFGL